MRKVRRRGLPQIISGQVLVDLERMTYQHDNRAGAYGSVFEGGESGGVDVFVGGGGFADGGTGRGGVDA